jgi:hypothetical protein
MRFALGDMQRCKEDDVYLVECEGQCGYFSIFERCVYSPKCYVLQQVCGLMLCDAVNSDWVVAIQPN